MQVEAAEREVREEKEATAGGGAPLGAGAGRVATGAVKFGRDSQGDDVGTGCGGCRAGKGRVVASVF